jgi:hypothetical protein
MMELTVPIIRLLVYREKRHSHEVHSFKVVFSPNAFLSCVVTKANRVTKKKEKRRDITK